MDFNSKTARVLRFSSLQRGGSGCCLPPDPTSSVTHLVFSLPFATPTHVSEINTNVESLQHQSNHVLGLILSSRLRTGNGPSRPAMRRGWWESRGIPYCCLWRDLTWDRPPLPSAPVPRHRVRPAPPDCPLRSPGC